MRQDMLEDIVAGAIGREQAQIAVQALMDELGGAEIYIPTGQDSKRLVRNSEIRDLWRRGVVIPDLADRFCLTESQIRRILGD